VCVCACVYNTDNIRYCLQINHSLGTCQQHSLRLSMSVVGETEPSQAKTSEMRNLRRSDGETLVTFYVEIKAIFMVAVDMVK